MVFLNLYRIASHNNAMLLLVFPVFTCVEKLSCKHKKGNVEDIAQRKQAQPLSKPNVLSPQRVLPWAAAVVAGADFRAQGTREKQREREERRKMVRLKKEMRVCCQITIGSDSKPGVTLDAHLLLALSLIKVCHLPTLPKRRRKTRTGIQ